VSDLDADDRLVASAIRARAARQGLAALGAGAAALALSIPPWLLPWLPAVVFGMCTLLPVVLGAVAVAGGLTALRTASGAGQDGGVARVLRARGVGAARVQAVAGLVLGMLGALSGASMLLMMDVEPVQPVISAPLGGPVDVTPR
jgi:hypothetical protein